MWERKWSKSRSLAISGRRWRFSTGLKCVKSNCRISWKISRLYTTLTNACSRQERTCNKIMPPKVWVLWSNRHSLGSNLPPLLVWLQKVLELSISNCFQSRWTMRSSKGFCEGWRNYTETHRCASIWTISWFTNVTRLKSSMKSWILPRFGHRFTHQNTIR